MVRPFPTRFLAAAAVLVIGALLVQWVSRGESVPARRTLAGLPLDLGRWTGRDLPLEPRLLAALGADDHLNRVYAAAGGSRVQLYIGYYASQRAGDTIHSPKNCIPGAGWDPVRSGSLRIERPYGAPLEVNDYLIEKGRDRQLVLYWYQGRGRVVAGEYSAKFWMVHDAILRNRTDGALVRVITPVRDSELSARARAVDFVRALYPHLEDVIPN